MSGHARRLRVHRQTRGPIHAAAAPRRTSVLHCFICAALAMARLCKRDFKPSGWPGPRGAFPGSAGLAELRCCCSDLGRPCWQPGLLLTHGHGAPGLPALPLGDNVSQNDCAGPWDKGERADLEPEPGVSGVRRSSLSLSQLSSSEETVASTNGPIIRIRP